MVDNGAMATYQVPESELTWTFGPSGGPGGQHANKAATRAELRWDVAASPSLDEPTRRRLLAALPGVRDGVVAIVDDSTRSQWRNRQAARRRLQERVTKALAPTKKRRPTKLPRAARERRRRAKERRSQLKKLRRPPEPD